MIQNQQNGKQEKVKFLTLGCRLNQYETQAMRENLLGAGYSEVRAGEQANVFVINTCTVTSEADKESRYLIRKCQRENPEAKIVVTGCYAERDYKTLLETPGVTHVVLNRQKSDLANLLDSCTQLTFQDPSQPLRSKAEFVPLQISKFSGRTRAFLKVQDGCNHACSFCKVVLVRGKSRSRELQDILEEAVRLRDHGYREIVLTGVQLGAYGLDLERKLTLSDVIDAMAPIDGIERIRLSSIEPNDVTDFLIETMRNTPKMCHHLHIPVQSGSDIILRGMNRRYQSDYYDALIQKLNERLESFILTTDVMVGFPGETDKDFQATVDLLLKTHPFKLHIFPYSPREGTRAFPLKPVAKEIVEKRITVLSQLEEKLRREVALHYLDSVCDMIVEESNEKAWLEGRAHNYLPILIPRVSGIATGDLIQARVIGYEEHRLMGELVRKN
ncbi:MAG: tRNA (N(6)-L-threonylcarbamoyladenosine(37)-C(2))-methylthiotransferase MtaB [Candidatus Omnitrophica bacterium]|nr:tRNA (N(6)-L-threonylcarbamoyladenosine(37)-C(2))-methylthiotransferase MtaB [Candidatus Omnitrophota bacterium]